MTEPTGQQPHETGCTVPEELRRQARDQHTYMEMMDLIVKKGNVWCLQERLGEKWRWHVGYHGQRWVDGQLVPDPVEWRERLASGKDTVLPLIMYASLAGVTITAATDGLIQEIKAMMTVIQEHGITDGIFLYRLHDPSILKVSPLEAIPGTTPQRATRIQRRLQQIPDVFQAGVGCIPSDIMTASVVRAIHDAADGKGWTDHGGETVPMHMRPTNKKRGSIYISLRPPDGNSQPTPDLLATLWEKVRALDDLTSDALLVCLAHWASRSQGPGTPVQITADAILDARGIKRKRYRAEPDNWQHGHRRDDRLAAWRAIMQLDSLWLETTNVEAIPENKRKRTKPKRLTLESRALAVLDQVSQQDLNGGRMFLATNVMPGKWAEAYWELGLREIGLLAKKALEYDPQRERVEKRLGKYLAFQYRRDAKHKVEAIRLKVSTILENSGLEPDPRNPQRTRTRLEQALTRLKKDRVLAEWNYIVDTSDLPAKGWLGVWLSRTIKIQLPDEIKLHYSSFHPRLPRGMETQSGTAPRSSQTKG